MLRGFQSAIPRGRLSVRNVSKRFIIRVRCTESVVRRIKGAAISRISRISSLCFFVVLVTIELCSILTCLSLNLLTLMRRLLNALLVLRK